MGSDGELSALARMAQTKSRRQDAECHPAAPSDDFILVFEIVVDHSLAVGHGLFGSATKRNSRNHSPFHRIDHCRTLGPAIEDKNLFRHGVINDGVRVRFRP